jgi:hypothetical protein
LNEEGHLQETNKTSPIGKMPITNTWFMVGVFGCWGGGAMVYEQEASKSNISRPVPSPGTAPGSTNHD